MTIHHTFAALDGARIPGGCDTCDAEQEPRIDAHGVIHIRIHHDDWCPTYRRIQAARRSHRPQEGR